MSWDTALSHGNHKPDARKTHAKGNQREKSWDTTFFVSHGIVRATLRNGESHGVMSCYATFPPVPRNFSETTETSEERRSPRHLKMFPTTFHGRTYARREQLRAERHSFSCYTTFTVQIYKNACNSRVLGGFADGERRHGWDEWRPV